MRPGLLVTIAALTALAGCGAQSSADTGPMPSPSLSWAPAPSGPATPPSPSTKVAAPLACEKPSAGLVQWTRDALVAMPGRIRAAALVHAARTKTGNWYVVALDNAGTYDDGRPTGLGRRVLGLTNDIRGHVGNDDFMIQIGVSALHHRPAMDWGNVDWSGATLAAGERAAERAVQCLDDQWTS